MNRRPSWQVYRGYEIEHLGEQWIIKRGPEVLHTAPSEFAATQWIDVKRTQALNAARAAARRKK